MDRLSPAWQFESAIPLRLLVDRSPSHGGAKSLVVRRLFVPGSRRRIERRD